MITGAEKYIKLMEQAIELFYQNEFQKLISLVEPEITSARLELRGEERMILVSLYNTLSGAYAALNQAQSAYDASLESLKFAKENMEEKDPDFGGVIRNTARLAQLSGKTEEAEEFYAEAIRVAEVAGGPFSPDISNVYLIRADVEQELGNAEKSGEFLQKAIEHMLKDEFGDGLAHSLQQIVGMLFQSQNFDLAIKVCEQGLDRMKEIYAQSAEPLQEDPGWVMNYGIARAVALREDYSGGLEPNVMVGLRNHLAQLYTNAQRHEDALAHCRIIEEQIEKVESLPKTTPEEAEKQEVMPRELLRADYELEQMEEGVALGQFHINRASFFTHYGSTLHQLGTKNENQELLSEAKDKYQNAKQFLSEEQHNPKELEELIDRNLGEVDKLLA